jgi:DNA-binding transcriptional regulator YiaG
MTGQELREARLRLGLNMRQMAEALETPYRTYQDWELGNRRILGVCNVVVFLLLKYKGAVNALLARET